MTITPIKLLFTVGMILGNPFFNHIPTIFETTNESVDRDELVKHLVYTSSIYFGKEVGEWMQGNYMMINDDTHTLCKGFDLNSISSDWRKAALDIHLMVEVDRDKIPSFC